MQTQMNRAVTVTIPNPTSAQMIAIAELLEAAEQNETAQTAVTTKKTKRSKPLKTVSDDEDETFGTKAMSEDDLEDIDTDEDEAPAKKTKSKKAVATDDDETDEDAETDTDSDEDDEEPSVTFQEVKAAINKYGEKHPDQMRAILLAFNIKGPKELAARHNEKYWEPVYRKVMAKLKAAKKSK